MASALKIYSLYKFPNEEKYYLLRTERPRFSNASQGQEDEAVVLEENIRTQILQTIAQTNSHSGFDYVGELQGFPIGDALYADHGTVLDIYYMETELGHPWIILGNANSEKEFLAELNDDEDLLRLKPLGQPKQIKVNFLTEEYVTPSGL